MKIDALLLLFFSLGLPLLTQAQYQPAKGLRASVDEIAAYTLPEVDNAALNAAEMSQSRKGRPITFAQPFEVSVTPESHGTWETLPNGNEVWRLRVESDEALSLNFGFTQYQMPPGGKLFIYTLDKKQVMGPFTPADNEEHSQLWTPIIPAAACVVEVGLPQGQRQNLALEIGYVNHGFLDLSSIHRSGSCNLDVVCGGNDGFPQVDDNRDIIRAGAFYSLNGTQTCSGALITNTNQDCTPYFLTADHCGVSAGNAPSMVVYWNYENSSCRQPNSAASGQNGDGNLNQFNSGAVSRAEYGNSDMYLVELDDPILETANAYMAGWNRATDAPSSAIGIHHPNLDEKRISFENDACDITSYSQNTPNPNGTHIRVPDWDVGTTEGGSSGSPLFDQNKRIVGQLTGGGAACGNNESDWYGRMAVNWEGGGTSNSRLKDWLDPNDSGVMFMDGTDVTSCGYVAVPTPEELGVCTGTDAVYSLEVSDNFTAAVNLSLSGLPASATPVFSANPANPGSTVTLTINTNGVPTGDYFLVLTASGGGNSGNSNLLLSVTNGLPTIPVLLGPADLAEEIAPLSIFQWQGDATTYQLQVATDAAFANLVLDESLEQSTFGFSLEDNTTYFWRVSATNSCGDSGFSNAFSFTTGVLSCLSETNNTPVTLPDGFQIGEYPSSINIPFSGIITDVNVLNVQGTHSFIGDLIFELTSPSGTTVLLLANQCDDLENFSITFDDEGSASLPCPFTDGNAYQPAGQLADFIGEEAQGTWTLTVEDTEFFDGGALNTWSLEICLQDAVANEDIERMGFQLFPNPSHGLLSIELPEAQNAQAQVLAVDGRLVATFGITQGRHTAELGHLPKGVYLVQVQTQNVTYTQKWVME